MSGAVLVTTPRLVLRRFAPDDAARLFELDADPEVMRYLNGGVPTPMSVVEEEILPWFSVYDEAAPGVGVWAVEGREDRAFIGWVGLMATGRRHEAALGFRLRRAAWGRGYATECAAALLTIGFDAGGLERIVATTYEDNLASRRVLEKLGMRLVRRFRYTSEELTGIATSQQDGANVWPGEDLEFAIDRAEWPRHAEAPK